MLKLGIHIEGLRLPELTPKDIDSLSKKVADAVRSVVVKATPKDSGKAQRSWTPVQKDEGGFSFGNPLEHISPLESGSAPGSRPWPSVGPRTVIKDGRIYSSQAPGGIIYSSDAHRVAARIAQDLLVQMVMQKG